MPFVNSAPSWDDQGPNSLNTQVLNLDVEYDGRAVEANIYVDSTDGEYSAKLPLSTLGDPDKRSVEVMFAVDTSGSMAGQIASVSSKLTKFMADINAAVPSNVSTKFGIHIHSDTGQGEFFGFTDVVNPTTRQKALADTTEPRPTNQADPGDGWPFSDAMSDVPADVSTAMSNWAGPWLQGGGDLPESQREALDSIAHYAPYFYSVGSYRGITRYCVLVTDAPSHGRTGTRHNPFRDTQPTGTNTAMDAAGGPLGTALADSRVKLFANGGGGNYDDIITSAQAGFASVPEATGYANADLNTVLKGTIESILTAIIADISGRQTAPSVVVPDDKEYDVRLEVIGENGLLEDTTVRVGVDDRTNPVISNISVVTGFSLHPFDESKLSPGDRIVQSDGTIING